VKKQVEVYDNGNVLVYDEEHPEDEHGRLSLVPLSLDDFEEFEVDAAEFERQVAALSRRVG
jgi:hypothetical protein